MKEAISQFNEKHCSALTAGVDEVGRGALAGDVFAAAVILDKEKSIDGLKDSKQLSEKQRVNLYYEIKEEALCFSIGRANVLEIDSLNGMPGVYSARFAGENCNSQDNICLLYTSPSPRDRTRSRMPSSA